MKFPYGLCDFYRLISEGYFYVDRTDRYIMDSETALERRYSDLLMLVRPDMRQYRLLDMLIEFKYIDLPTSKFSAEQIRQLSNEEFGNLAPVRKKFAEAKTALEDYRKTLQAKYGELLRLHTYSVIALGFERLVWRETGEFHEKITNRRSNIRENDSGELSVCR